MLYPYFTHPVQTVLSKLTLTMTKSEFNERSDRSHYTHHGLPGTTAKNGETKVRVQSILDMLQSVIITAHMPTESV